MKYFTLILFLFSTILLNAQTAQPVAMEEIAYIPSRSGYYNNLVVKGNVHINRLQSFPVDMAVYSSLLKVNMETKTEVSVTISTGTAIIDVDDGGTTSGNNQQTPKTIVEYGVPIHFEGGYVSISSFDDEESHRPSLEVLRYNFPSDGATIDIKTENAKFKQLENTDSTSMFMTPGGGGLNNYVHVKDLHIFGMKFPICHGGTSQKNQWKWTPVSLPDNTIVYILSCGYQQT